MSPPDLLTSVPTPNRPIGPEEIPLLIAQLALPPNIDLRKPCIATLVSPSGSEFHGDLALHGMSTARR
jgi:hypothetical protein